MMVSSRFTLEYTTEEEGIIVLNVARDQFPEQLKKLGINESEWHDVWDYVQGVAGRAVQREKAKQQLNIIIADQKKAKGENVSWGFGKKKKGKNVTEEKKEPKKSEYELKKEAYDKDTEKGWNNAISKANKKWQDKGVNVKTIREARTGQVFGLEFECDFTKLQSNKVELRYDFRRDAWTLPRETVPNELSAIGMTLSSWTSIWDMTQAAFSRNQREEDEKKKAQNRMKNTHLNLMFRGEQGDELEVKKYTTFVNQMMQNMNKSDKASERAWKILESKAQDVSLSWGVMASLLVHETEVYGGDESFMYSGLQLRIIPSKDRE